METVALRPGGDRLFVNADASKGVVSVAVLDADGSPLPGYGEGDCAPLQGAGVRQQVRWKQRDRLPADTPVRLRFSLKNADLFSYRVE